MSYRYVRPFYTRWGPSSSFGYKGELRPWGRTLTKRDYNRELSWPQGRKNPSDFSSKRQTRSVVGLTCPLSSRRRQSSPCVRSGTSTHRTGLGFDPTKYLSWTLFFSLLRSPCKDLVHVDKWILFLTDLNVDRKTNTLYPGWGRCCIKNLVNHLIIFSFLLSLECT